MLLENGADKNKTNRWGETPLGEAIRNKQAACVELLQRWKASLQTDNAVGALCDAASKGDVITLRQLIESNVNPRVGDYDGRTPLHLAAAEGHQKAAEYLIACKAEVNAEDRWGERPIQVRGLADGLACQNVYVCMYVCMCVGVCVMGLLVR